MKISHLTAFIGYSVLSASVSAQVFQDVTTQAGFSGSNLAMLVSSFDYDGDGFLDLITSGHVQEIAPYNVTQIFSKVIYIIHYFIFSIVWVALLISCSINLENSE